MRSEYCRRCYLDRPKGWISICRKQAVLQEMVVQLYLCQVVLITSEVTTLNEVAQSPVFNRSAGRELSALASLSLCSSGVWNGQFLSQEDRNYFSGLPVLVPVFCNFCIDFTRVQFLVIFFPWHCCTVATYCSYFTGMKCCWGSETWSCIGHCVTGHWTKDSTLGSFLYPDPN